jgi:hypothetical protein
VVGPGRCVLIFVLLPPTLPQSIRLQAWSPPSGDLLILSHNQEEGPLLIDL